MVLLVAGLVHVLSRGGPGLCLSLGVCLLLSMGLGLSMGLRLGGVDLRLKMIVGRHVVGVDWGGLEREEAGKGAELGGQGCIRVGIVGSRDNFDFGIGVVIFAFCVNLIAGRVYTRHGCRC